MATTRNDEKVNSAWVAQAAARAEARSRTKGQTSYAPSSLSQLQLLIDAIRDDRISRRQLREIAKSVSEGRS